jgi:hypothetical protein
MVNDKLEQMCKEEAMAWSRYNPSVCLKWLSKAMKYLSQDGRSPPKYKFRVLELHQSAVWSIEPCSTCMWHPLQKLFSLLVQCIHLYTTDVRDLPFFATVFCVLLY